MISTANGRGRIDRFAANVEGKITQAVRADLVEHEGVHPGDTQGDIAESIGAKYGDLNQAVNGYSPWKVALVAKLARGGFYGAIRALCEQCGGLFVLAPREGRGTTFKAANRALLKMMREAHEALEACFAAMADGVITETEQRRCLAELDQMIAAADAARQRIQEMPVQREIGHA